MTLVVITSRTILILTVVTVIVATLLFQSVPFPTEHVTSSSQQEVRQEREMSTACCDKSTVTLETNPILLP